ncbi:MAG: 1-acyl-sn-glycerol-3-phosphate acyltransferase [Pseudomonadota bacterium]|nr:1-acyl-sn-glycerol-3-phosphate acyltransferase [Pseudomonadota bacterium]
MEKVGTPFRERLLNLIFFWCRLRLVQWLTNRCCVNKVRLQKTVVVKKVVEAVNGYYREHKLEAAMDARQARIYQKIYFRQKAKSIRQKLTAPEAEAPAIKDPAKLQTLLFFYRRRALELNKQKQPAAIIDYLSRYYIEDMAADFDPAFLITFRSIARHIFPHFVKSIRLSEEEPGVFAQVRDLMGKAPVFILPNHISNADHIPICIAINGFSGLHPVIAAGANLFRGVSNWIMPRVNAYKIRREHLGRDSRWFQNLKWFHNPVYRQVHSEYLHYLWDHNEPFMFYIEGTRSRDGRIGKPKKGIMENMADYVKNTGRQVYLVPVSLSYTIVPEDVDIEASRTGKNISEKDIFTQLAILDKQYAKLPDSAIHVHFSTPISYGAESKNLDDTVTRLMESISRGVVRPYTSLLAEAIMNMDVDGRDEKSFTIQEISDYFLEHFESLPEVADADVAHDIMMAIEAFCRKGFIRQDRMSGDFQLENMPLIRQYARRIAHLS